MSPCCVDLENDIKQMSPRINPTSFDTNFALFTAIQATLDHDFECETR